MRIDDIQVSTTYEGSPDHDRGLGPVRTVFNIGTDDTAERLVMFRVEPGREAPICYVSHSTMPLSEFAAWADKAIPAPPPPEAGLYSDDHLPSPLLVVLERGYCVRFRTPDGGLDAVFLQDEVTTLTAAKAAHALGHKVRYVLDSRTIHGRPHLIHGLS